MISLETMPMTKADEVDPFYKAPIKRFDDGTFEMIPERPEPEQVNFNEYLEKQRKLINNGDNIMEYIKILPIKANEKLQLF